MILDSAESKSMKINESESEHERAALASAARFFPNASWAPLAIFIEERELSAARYFHWRAQDERRSNFTTVKVSRFFNILTKKMSFKPWKWQKWQNLKVSSKFYHVNTLLVLMAKYFMRGLSERKKNFASPSWAPLSYWKASSELSAARDFH